MRRLAAMAVLLATTVALVVGSSALAGLAGGREAQNLAQLQGVNFVVACRFSHRAPDDPIVAPGKPGASHDHSFVGNRSTSAASTLASLRTAGSTCHRPGDRAAYWMPTLLVGGQAVEPAGATIYYRRRTFEPVQAFPQGLRIVAGSAAAQAPQGRMITFWNCGAMTDVPASATVPTCPDTRRGSLRLHVSFPDCWNGVSLDSADHMSHMAYSRRGRCPATHALEVPRISLIYRYASTGGPATTLSSGGQLSAHADFFNAWRPGALNRLVQTCLNALRHCQKGN